MITVSPGFLLLAALLYFSGGGCGVCACLSGALAHELGHLAALVLVSCRVKRLRLTVSGFVLDTGDALTPEQNALVLVSGPFGGLLFAALCLGLNGRFFLSAGTGALLCTFVNLLPILPLDGGQLLRLGLLRITTEVRTRHILTLTGILFSLGFLLSGLLFSASGLLVIGIWLSVLVIRFRLR